MEVFLNVLKLISFTHTMFKYDVIAEKCFHSEVFCEDINLLLTVIFTK